ncbi:GNAT family N-acetyltransferase [Shouchella patagoniensis]|uniref:GNAT family N-acetyltransferase n=1 Tax=Shouchella patagoniensis TaxID=228576 RepID=UPI00147672FD|nr:GNAT family N-acetyltransferase [Shouchella patagoniensis]
MSNDEVFILHLAVLTHFQSRGIGSAMINFIRFLEPGATLTAETDREAVGFYYKNGFIVRSLGEVYPVTERFSYVRFKNKKEI